MTSRHGLRTLTTYALSTLLATAAIIAVVGAQDIAPAPLTIDTARISIAGTSNVHPYTASTTSVRVTRVQLSSEVTGANFWEEVIKPGRLEAFDVAIPAATLSSPRDGLDKNMHKALNVQQHADIVFRLQRVEAGAAGALKAIGILRIAGVEREVALDIHTERKDSTLAVKGELHLLMTDYGIAPPKAMLGMLKTDPKVTVTFETVLTTYAPVRTVAE